MIVDAQVAAQAVGQSSQIWMWILGLSAAALFGLVGALYYQVIKNQDKSEKRYEKRNEEISAALVAANKAHEDLRKEMSANLKQAEDDAEKTHDKLWTEINVIKGLFIGIDKQHSNWCQKHEDKLSALESKDSEFDKAIYKLREHTLTDLKLAFDNRMNYLEKAITEINIKNRK